MRIHTLEIQGFRRIRDARLEFPDGVTALVGANGAGKSTILEALCFALFGTRALRTRKDAVRHDAAAPADDVVVVLEAEISGQAVRIERRLKGKSQTPQGTVEVDGVLLVPPGAGSADGVTQTVQERLGLDLEGFRATVMAGQKDLGRLDAMGGAERKRRILSMLGVDRLDEAIRRGRQARSDAQTRLDGMRTMLSDEKGLQEAITAATVALDRAQADRSQVEAAWKASQEALEAARKDAQHWQQASVSYETTRRKAEQARREREMHRATVTELQKRIAAAEEARARAEQLASAAAAWNEAAAAVEEARRAAAALAAHRRAEARLESMRRDEAAAREALDATGPVPEARGEFEDSTRRLAAAQARLDHARERAGRLHELGADAPCPACERPLHDHLPKVLEDAAQEVAEAEEEMAGAREAHSGARARAEAADAYAKARDRHGRLQQRLADALQQVPPAPESVPELEPLEEAAGRAKRAHEERIACLERARGIEEDQARMEQAERSLAEAQGRLEAADQEMASAPEPTNDAHEAQQRLRRAEETERAAERTHLAAKSHEVQARSALQVAQQRREEERQRRARVAHAQHELRHWNALAAPRTGMLERFRDHLTARIGPAIAAEAGRLLGHFTEGRYDEVVLDADYGVHVVDGGVAHGLDRFSGGEADVVHLAIRLAVSRLLAERTGAQVRFLALDEVFGSLDSDRRGLVVAALQRLGGLYAQVLVVTHLGELREALDHTLEATMEGPASLFTWHKG